MSSYINYTDTAAKAQEAKRQEAHRSAVLAAAEHNAKWLPRFKRWLVTPLWGRK